MITCKECRREVVLEGIECPLCGANNTPIEASKGKAPTKKAIRK